MEERECLESLNKAMSFFELKPEDNPIFALYNGEHLVLPSVINDDNLLKDIVDFVAISQYTKRTILSNYRIAVLNLGNEILVCANLPEEISIPLLSIAALSTKKIDEDLFVNIELEQRKRVKEIVPYFQQAWKGRKAC